VRRGGAQHRRRLHAIGTHEEGGAGATRTGISLGFEGIGETSSGIGGNDLLRDWGRGRERGLGGRTTTTQEATRDQPETHRQ
jgi:hypothetical protein